MYVQVITERKVARQVEKSSRQTQKDSDQLGIYNSQFSYSTTLIESKFEYISLTLCLLSLNICKLTNKIRSR